MLHCVLVLHTSATFLFFLCLNIKKVNDTFKNDFGNDFQWLAFGVELMTHLEFLSSVQDFLGMYTLPGAPERTNTSSVFPILTYR